MIHVRATPTGKQRISDAITTAGCVYQRESPRPAGGGGVCAPEGGGGVIKTGYSRDEFGAAWTDVDRNGCDTRNDVLARDFTSIVQDPDGCTVRSGPLNDPYTGKVIAFTRGVGTSTAVQIDHVVALSDAWQKGAQYWEPVTRVAFANDPIELLAVDGPTNQAKSDGDAATWLPPATGYRCTYVARQITIKAKYALWVTQAEHDAMSRILDSCPGQPLAVG